MKSLISIGFWMADPIAQTVRMRLIYPGDSYINVEAVIQFFLFILRSENDAYGTLSSKYGIYPKCYT